MANMRPIIRWCLGNRPVVLLFAIIVMGAGIVSVFRLNQELLPSIEFPAVYILIPEPGAGPEIVDRDVSQPTVSNLKGLNGLKHVTSTSSQGFSQVSAEFSLDSSLKDDADAVSQRMSRLQLPSGAGKPLIQTFNFTAVPTMTYSLAATDGGLVRATKEANDVILPALDGAADTAQVKVSGGEQTGIAITLDPDKLAARGLSPGQVQQALAANQVDLPAGATLRAGTTLPVEVLGSLRSPEDLRRFVVGVEPTSPLSSTSSASASIPSPGPPAAVSPGPTGTPVRLGDVARVSEVTTPLNGISRTDGIPSLEIQVIRASNGNAVTVSSAIKDRIQKLHLDPADNLTLTYDAAEDIRASINDLLLEGLLGAFLAVLVIFLFLGSLRATLVTAVSLPASVLVALLGTNLGGFSLNVMTLAGLTVAIGRIVDDAIVVLENSYRHLQRGEAPREAALNGAVEVASPVISSTLATVAVFLPIGLVGGIISRFFLPFSVTVAISLVASLLVALTVIPVLVSLFLQRRQRQAPERGILVRAYQPVLEWSIQRGLHKAGVLVLAAALLVGSAMLLTVVPKNFFGFGGSAQLQGQITLPAGTSTEQTSELMKRFEAAAKDDRDVKLVQVTMSSSDYGAYTGSFNTNQARINILLKSKAGAEQVDKRLKRKLNELYGSGNSQLDVLQPGPPSSGFVASASGRDPATLRTASDMLVQELSKDPELTNVKSDLAAEKPELLVTVDATRAQAHGLNPEVLALSISNSLSPQPVGQLGVAGATVSMQLDPNSVTAEKLGNLRVAPGTLLRDVATIDDQRAPTAINRKDGTQQVAVSATVQGNDTSGVSNRATARIQQLRLPPGVSLDTGGTSSDINDSFNSMFQAIAIAIGIVFIILVAFFRSVVTPFVILTTMPLSLIGAFVALYVFRQPLGLPALLGILMVFGIVVSNAILLVHVAEDARGTQSLHDALIYAGTLRLRPILMTAAATVTALLPVAIGISTAGGGGLISQSLAIVVEGGLISSTALTLIVVPVVYSILRRGPRVAQTGQERADAEPRPTVT
jgi:hydrophobic/amphiphilic exporter-1 (mainly G- bacteria), HAE1 family